MPKKQSAVIGACKKINSALTFCYLVVGLGGGGGGTSALLTVGGTKGESTPAVTLGIVSRVEEEGFSE